MVASLIEPTALRELEAAARAAPAGDFVEIGVYHGGSAMVLYGVAEEQGRTLYLYDTFSGIPESSPGEGDLHQVGDFGDASLEAVQAAMPNAVITQGVFPHVLMAGLGLIALAHIDCDQYVSTVAACRHLAHRMVPGGVMIFDDYNCLRGATRAVDAAFGHQVQTAGLAKARVTFPASLLLGVL